MAQRLKSLPSPPPATNGAEPAPPPPAPPPVVVLAGVMELQIGDLSGGVVVNPRFITARIEMEDGFDLRAAGHRRWDEVMDELEKLRNGR